uniref:ARAD1B08580p n=1 Tax=Blastobotrys adeninivorans TaxID=409370 RepID=A0A060T5N9_BLAAD
MGPRKKVKLDDSVDEVDDNVTEVNKVDNLDNVEEKVEEDELSAYEFGTSRDHTDQGTLYLDTIDRRKLDFDFEKLCSVSLANVNVYACLTCGKYFQGRGKSSYAYLHSVDIDHHVFINLDTKRIYVLPEGYEVKSAALDDIKYVLDPVYTLEEVKNLDKAPVESYDLNHEKYQPGFVGLNNMKHNDYANVILHMLAHIQPVRDHFILHSASSRSELYKRMGILVRKMWNPRAFKSHVSPHELLQQVSTESKKRFTPIKQEDPFQFFVWLANSLMRVDKKPIGPSFQGKVKIEQLTDGGSVKGERTVPFLFLGLDLPPAPLFHQEGQPIPQVALIDLLKKFNGSTIHELPNDRRRYSIVKLPRYVVLHIKRFSEDSLVDSRNRTVVSFSPRGLDLGHLMGEHQLYDLAANVTYELEEASEGEHSKVNWKVQILNKAKREWVQIQDLVVQSVRAELLFLNESYIQVWERR